MKHYVVGFRFTADFKFVTLIKKAKPAWQAGLLNGIGGLIEAVDLNAFEAMSREFNEETLHYIEPLLWSEACLLAGTNFILHVLYYNKSNIKKDYNNEAIWSKRLIEYQIAKSQNPDTIIEVPLREDVDWYPANTIWSLDTIQNLRWIIPLIMDKTIKKPIMLQDIGVNY